MKHRIKTLLKSSLAVCVGVMATAAQALTLPLPEQGDVVGNIQFAEAHAGEKLADIGRRYDIGAQQMQQANPNIPAERQLHTGTKVLIPSQFILPNAPREGIVINLAEQRLYYYPTERAVVVTEPVGIGREGKWQTPLGKTKVVKKVVDPYWHPTVNVRLEAAKNGTPIPYEFPPGPNNPLGKHIMRLGWPTYLIHGTNDPDTVGGRVSAGCIRLLPAAMTNLYKQIAVGTSVTVVNTPYKIGWLDNRLYIEAHLPLEEEREPRGKSKAALVNSITNRVEAFEKAWVNWRLVQKFARQANGIPQIIGQS